MSTSTATDTQDVPSQLFNKFTDSSDLQTILNTFQALCGELQVDATQRVGFYEQLKSKLSNWKSRSLWEILDKRVANPVYEGGSACRDANVLVVGAGPCGLRFALEAALLGARKVVVVEKRRAYSRNNVLHLWPYLITDLRSLGAKKFFGKFCAGSLDHISIRRLECILLKVCLILGVHIYTGVQYNDVIEPAGGYGWRASFQPATSPISDMDFDVVIGADGRRSSLLKRGFKQKEFRAQLAIAITANFAHGNTTAEASVPEISGVAYIYHQDFFKKLSEEFGIDLENIVYYKDETHYFVMTAKKHSLLNKGVLKQDHSDAIQLVASSNVNHNKLYQYAREAAAYVTKEQLPHYDFEPMPDGRPDVALFDFTSMYAADHAARILERGGKRLMLALVGDSILEPFWPLGTGAARGFFSCMDAAWMMKKFTNGCDPLELLAERENVFHLLPQTSPKKLVANHAAYTINPTTRYPSIYQFITDMEVTQLYDTDRVLPQPVKSAEVSVPVQKKSSVGSSEQSKKAKVSVASAGRKRSMGYKQRPPRFFLKRNRQNVSFSESTTPSPRLLSPPPTTELPLCSTAKQLSKGEPPRPDHPMPVGELVISVRDRNLDKCEPEQKGKTRKFGQSKMELAVTDLRKTDDTKVKKDSHLGRQSRKALPDQQVRKDSIKSGVSVGSVDDRCWQLRKQSQVKEVSKKEEQVRMQEEKREKEILKKEETEKRVKENQEKEQKEREKLQKEKKREEREKWEESLEKEMQERERLERLEQEQRVSWKQEALEKEKKRLELETEREQMLKARQEKLQSKSERNKSKMENRVKGRMHRDRNESNQSEKEQKERLKHEKQQPRADELEALQEQASLLSQAEQKLRRGGDQNSSPFLENNLSHRSAVARAPYHPSQKFVSRLRKPSPVKRVSSAVPVIENSSSHVITEKQAPRGGATMEVKASHRFSSVSSSVNEVSKVVQRPKTRGSFMPHGRGSDEELVKRVARVVRARSLKQPRPSCIVRKRSHVTRRCSNDETDLMEKCDVSSSDTSDDEDILEMSSAARRMSMILKKMCDRLEHSQAELALHVLGALTANVQSHRDDDTFRRIRVSSLQFKVSVWDIDEAQDFLFDCGWMPFGDFIVLAVDADLSEALSLLDDLIRDFHERLLNGDIGGSDQEGDDNWQYRLGLMSRIKHKMLSKSMSYTSALVEASADKLLQREDELDKATDHQMGPDEVESLPDDASTSQHIERASSLARHHWQEKERSIHPSTRRVARELRGHRRGDGERRRKTFSAVVGRGQHRNMIEIKSRQIGDSKAKHFLEAERRKRRFASASEKDAASVPTSGHYKSQAAAVCTDDDPFDSEVTGSIGIRGASVSAPTRLHLRLGSAPDSDLLSPSPVTESSPLCEPVSVQKAKEELQRMAAQLDGMAYRKQTPSNSGLIASRRTHPSVERASLGTQKQNGSSTEKSHSLEVQKKSGNNTSMEQETKSTMVNTETPIQKTLSSSSLPLKSLLTANGAPTPQTSGEREQCPHPSEDVKMRQQDGTVRAERPYSAAAFQTEDSLSRREELDVAIKASIAARAKLAELGAK